MYRGMPSESMQILARAEPFIVRGFMTAAVLAAATAGVAWGLRTARLSPAKAIVVLALLVAVDLVRVDSAFIQVSDYEAFRAADPNIDLLLERQRTEDPFRVFSLQGLNGQDVPPGDVPVSSSPLGTIPTTWPAIATSSAWLAVASRSIF